MLMTPGSNSKHSWVKLPECHMSSWYLNVWQMPWQKGDPKHSGVPMLWFRCWWPNQDLLWSNCLQSNVYKYGWLSCPFGTESKLQSWCSHVACQTAVCIAVVLFCWHFWLAPPWHWCCSSRTSIFRTQSELLFHKCLALLPGMLHATNVTRWQSSCQSLNAQSSRCHQQDRRMHLDCTWHV